MTSAVDTEWGSGWRGLLQYPTICDAARHPMPPLARTPFSLQPYRTIVLAIALWIVSISALAQQNAAGPVRLDGEELFPVAGGYVGIVREGDVAQITRYDRTMRQLAVHRRVGLSPQSIARTQAPLPASICLLLAAPAGRAALFSLSLSGDPAPTLVWASQLPPFRQIISIGDFDNDGSGEIALVGDSAFAVVGFDGRERFIVRGDVISAFLIRTDSTRFIVTSRSNGLILTTWLNARTGNRIDARSYRGEHALTSMSENEVGEPLLLLATDGVPVAAHIIDPARRQLIDRFEIGTDPVAFLSTSDGDRNVPSAIFRDYPTPLLLPLVKEGSPGPIDYPFSSVLTGAKQSGEFVALFGGDSVAIYSKAMHLLGTAGPVGNTNPRFEQLDSGRFLVATQSGSMIVALDTEGPTWLERHWSGLLTGVAALLLAGLLVTAWRRYTFTRSIYDNLVRVPTSNGIIVISSRRRVRRINASARAMLGISPYIPVGMHVNEYLGGDELTGLLTSLRQLFSDGARFEIRADVTSDAGPRALRFRGGPMYSRYGFSAGYLLLIEDVTETLEHERLINWASVAHHIAHEMKTPLGTVRMSAEMLNDRFSGNGSDPECLRASARILRQSERLRSIVDDLMTVARTEAIQKSSADLSLLVGSLVGELREHLPPAVEVRYREHGEVFRCAVDVQQITVAIRNLLDNARQAIGLREGGCIEVTLTGAAEQQRLEIKDNGVGMRPETLAHLFQPFFTEREGGSGIGTVIVKRVVEGHGGTVHVESQPGLGTTFVISLPCA